MSPIFLEVTIVIALATVLALIFRFFKQPPILAFVLTGIIVGPIGLFSLEHTEFLKAMGEFGITFLLFMLGLEMKFSELKGVGKFAFFVGLGQIVLTAVLGFFLSMLLGFDKTASIYIALALTFSSTIIIVKLLSDKRDLTSLYGKVTIVVLLLQDFLAIAALIVLAGLGQGQAVTPSVFAITILKGIAIVSIIALLSKLVLPRVIKHIAHSGELLFLFSLAWVFVIAAIVSSPFIGFSIEIGGFLAGVSLANSVQHFQIASRVRSLRDFFITIFFIALGMEMVFTDVGDILLPAIILSLFVLVIGPLIVMTIMALLGFKKRTAFLASIALAQISEFSLILIFIGSELGHVPPEVVTLITIVAIVTFIASTYMILNGNKLYSILEPYLKIFEFRHKKEAAVVKEDFENHTVLVGANRAGEHILDALLKKDHKVVVVDFDPETVSALKNESVPVVFGDIADPEIQAIARVKHAHLIVSSATDMHDNIALLHSLKRVSRKPHTILFAQDREDAMELYNEGAEYVVVPHFSGGLHVAEIIADEEFTKLDKLKEVSLKQL